MPDTGQKTEKPTPGRRKKARDEGRFASSRDLVAALQFTVAVALGCTAMVAFIDALSRMFIGGLRAAFSGRPVTGQGMASLTASLLTEPVGAAGKFLGILFIAGAAVQLVSTGFGFSPKQLLPAFNKLDPRPRLRQMPMQNLFSTGKALILAPLIVVIVYLETARNIPDLVNLEAAPLGYGLNQVGAIFKGLLWRLALLLIVFGVIDFLRQRRRFENDLRMSRQEVKDELRDSEGNPQLKIRIRRLQRDAARRSMMKAIPKATAIVVNPTHYAVALQYEMNSKAVPSVVAKGKNYLALAIRQKALEHEIPIVENRPLAQALYDAVAVGQEIPPHLYRAVAEVLAYIYRTLSRR